jgi:hypothetical protein
MHVVHYRRNLSSVQEAGNYDSGIRVIVIFFRVWTQFEILSRLQFPQN